ncbi:MAG: DUF2330 domain-containing protein [Verrucomicrobia bacterium]|nr:DUF2330 domain-containing protein [Verrucomicrobiota bacterium]
MKSISAVMLLSVAFTITCDADMGSIPFKKGVRIVEPNQDAIIAWNGKEQLLYLQTTLGASEETKILEVMPLPSKPKVEATDIGVFTRCKSLLPRVVVRDSGGADPFGPFSGPAEIPAARVVERKMIGAHDIRTVELLDAERFSAWVTAEFGAANEGLEVPAPLLAVISDYAKDGYKWFLFDVVDVKQEAAKKTPLRIRFETDKLYYPMRITRTEKGHTTVSLSILTNILFNKEDCVGIPRESFRVPARPITISGAQVNWIDPPLFALLGRPQAVQLRTWEISGEIDTFEKDLLIRNPATAKRAGEQVVPPNGP